MLGAQTGLWTEAITGKPPGGRPFGGHATLTDGLVSYWQLGESSGDRADALGVNDLSDVNTVGSAAVAPPPDFPDANAALFVSTSNEYLTNASTPTLQGGITDFSIAGWIKTSMTAVGYPVSRNNTNDYALNVTAGGKLRWAVNAFSRTITSTASVNDDVWHFFAAWYDRTGTTIYLSIDNAAAQTSPGAVAWDPPDAANFRMGTWNALADFYDGQIAGVGFWTRILTAQERTDLYNSGAGLFYR